MRFQAFYHLISGFEMEPEGSGMSGALKWDRPPLPSGQPGLGHEGHVGRYPLLVKSHHGVIGHRGQRWRRQHFRAVWTKEPEPEAVVQRRGGIRSIGLVNPGLNPVGMGSVVSASQEAGS